MNCVATTPVVLAPFTRAALFRHFSMLMSTLNCSLTVLAATGYWPLVPTGASDRPVMMMLMLPVASSQYWLLVGLVAVEFGGSGGSSSRRRRNQPVVVLTYATSFHINGGGTQWRPSNQQQQLPTGSSTGSTNSLFSINASASRGSVLDGGRRKELQLLPHKQLLIN